MKNPYAQVIKELAKAHDYKALIFKIAEVSPAAVLKAIDATDENGWRKECRALAKAGEKIRAIKLWRQETGASLVDAKNAVESL